LGYVRRSLSAAPLSRRKRDRRARPPRRRRVEVVGIANASSESASKVLRSAAQHRSASEGRAGVRETLARKVGSETTSVPTPIRRQLFLRSRLCPYFKSSRLRCPRRRRLYPPRRRRP